MPVRQIFFMLFLAVIVWWTLSSLPNGSADGGQSSGLQVGQMIPDFVAYNLDGTKNDIKQKLGKKFMLINFWATWCPPCQEEMPLLNQLQAKLGLDKLEVLGFMEDDVDDIKGFAPVLAAFHKKIPVNITVLGDVDAAVVEKFGTHRLPESYLVDLSGKVVAKYVGALAESDVKKIEKMVSAAFDLK